VKSVGKISERLLWENYQKLVQMNDRSAS
jgi:hypothetical protein